MYSMLCAVSTQDTGTSVSVAAYACVSLGEGNTDSLVRVCPNGTTHNAAYLESVTAAVESASLFEEVFVLTNASYVTEGLKSVSSWRAKGWRNSSGAVPNRERWERLVELLAQKPGVRVQHLSEVSTSPELRTAQSIAQALAKAAAAGASPSQPEKRHPSEELEEAGEGPFP